VNTGGAKYLQFIGGTSTTLPWTNVSSAAEWTAIDAVFDEFFIRSVTLKYMPRNKYSAQSTASASATGSPGDVNTCAATVVFLHHNAAPYGDTSSTWTAACNAQQHKLVNLGDNWSFTARNPEKFSFDGPLGDQSSVATMGWCNIAQSGHYGGFFQLATPLASGASAGIGALLEGGVFGDFIIVYDVAFRARA